MAALFYGLPRRAGRYVLLIASYYFYARWNAWYLLFLWILTASDFLIALGLERARERGYRNPRLLLALGIAANLAFLSSFKYSNFASGTVAALLGMHQNPWIVSLFVPIGISFHTFQSISYLVDVYRGRITAIRKPLDYALYLAFFPQLLAGPIVRAGLFFGELFAWRPPGPEDISYGLARVGFGLVKKMAIADQFAGVANVYWGSIATHPGAPAAWSALFAFAMQIYFDFSGYSDIAIGCARLFGFVFPGEFPDAVSSDERHRLLAPLAHHALDLAARLSLYPARRQPSRACCDLAQPDADDAARRPLARRAVDLRCLGRLSWGHALHRTRPGHRTRTKRRRADSSFWRG